MEYPFLCRSSAIARIAKLDTHLIHLVRLLCMNPMVAKKLWIPPSIGDLIITFIFYPDQLTMERWWHGLSYIVKNNVWATLNRAIAGQSQSRFLPAFYPESEHAEKYALNPPTWKWPSPQPQLRDFTELIHLLTTMPIFYGPTIVFRPDITPKTRSRACFTLNESHVVFLLRMRAWFVSTWHYGK